MKCPVDIRRVPEAQRADALQKVLDELYQLHTEQASGLRNGQKTPVAFEKFRVKGSVRNHWYEISVDDSDPDSPVISLFDVGTKGL